MTLDFGSGHDPRVAGSGPMLGSVQILSLPLSLPPLPFALSLKLKKNIVLELAEITVVIILPYRKILNHYVAYLKLK